ncbi:MULTISPECIES: TIGR03745 family integrating conjugative element membrane protein [Pseudomonas]|jgi:integrating conjugative element membrane protein (TIGR03745 family)|uniref:TIGR03745 family integrating conjugative element membrane protein n=2 Tax=Pseudomonas fluorescens group TaxID=136843 RepID=A0A8I1E133_9PSED|nr:MULTISPECIES: TIGR03745 family integrating conjugative element membrane protein [Pseudomonas]MDP9058141.1 TIGR03745 family integrating conjugative element membrane protein [Pseudomonadota bacterium]KRC89053.1 conjugal transfer protein [Pseudomonas sp. Root9]MBI6623053.1 TIGR03745 family integrating conjugative element membrane protein [Pseudomonas rhodesiae]MBL1308511.1 TIGR03745 family integrating conjugative element membrane protein [Pseudomonas sp.]MDE1909832.1 TIGR03745 family integrati
MTLHQQTRRLLIGIIALPQLAMAALPQSQPPTRGEGSNLMQTMQNYAFDGFSLLGLIICAVIFSGVAWHAFGTYHEIQLGKKKWGDLGATAAVGVAILGVAIFLITKATNIL